MKEKTVLGFVQDTFFLMGMTGLASGLNFLATYVQAKVLGPGNYGHWQVLSTVLVYAAMFDLGVTVGIGRDVPYHLGRKDEDAYRKTAGTVFLWNLALSVIVGIVLVLRAGALAKGMGRFGWLMMGAFVVVYCFSNYYQLMIYSHQGLRLWSFLTFARAGLRVAVSASLAHVGVSALMAGWVLAELPVIFAAKRFAPYLRLYWCFDKGVFKRLILLGFPLFLLTLTYWQARIGDRAIVALFMDTTSMGYYSLASMAGAFLLMAASQVNQSIHPRLLKKYGETHDVAALKDYVLKPCLAIARGYPFLMGLVVLLAPPFFQRFLPEYGQAVPLVKIIAVGSFFMALPQTQSTLLLALERQWTSLGVWCCVLAVSLGMNYLLLSHGWGMMGVAVSTVASWILAFCFYMGISLPMFFTPRQALDYAGELFKPFLYALGLLMFLRWLVLKTAAGGAGELGAAVLFSAVYAPVLWRMNKEYGVWNSMLSYVRQWQRQDVVAGGEVSHEI